MAALVKLPADIGQAAFQLAEGVALGGQLADLPRRKLRRQSGRGQCRPPLAAGMLVLGFRLRAASVGGLEFLSGDLPAGLQWEEFL